MTAYPLLKTEKRIKNVFMQLEPNYYNLSKKPTKLEVNIVV